MPLTGQGLGGTSGTAAGAALAGPVGGFVGGYLGASLGGAIENVLGGAASDADGAAQWVADAPAIYARADQLSPGDASSMGDAFLQLSAFYGDLFPACRDMTANIGHNVINRAAQRLAGSVLVLGGAAPLWTLPPAVRAPLEKRAANALRAARAGTLAGLGIAGALAQQISQIAAGLPASAWRFV